MQQEQWGSCLGLMTVILFHNKDVDQVWCFSNFQDSRIPLVVLILDLQVE